MSIYGFASNVPLSAAAGSYSLTVRINHERGSTVLFEEEHSEVFVIR